MKFYAKINSEALKLPSYIESGEIMAKNQKREMLLRAAADIVNEQGVSALTLDAVAQRAEVSKGGLLYHFNTKQALIQGLVDHANELYKKNVNHYIDNEKESKWLHAFIEATREHRKENKAVTSAILAAQGNDRNLLGPLQETYQDWQNHIESDGLDAVDATIYRLAVDGLWLSEIFGLTSIDEDMREAVLDRLKELSNK